MLRIVLVPVFCLVAFASYADEPYVLTVPGQGWSIQISLPPLSQYQAENVEQGFRFMGSSSDSGVIVSVFVETVDADNSNACRTQYWASGSRNPMIVKESVQLTDIGKYPGVAYILESEVQGQQVKSANANIYIAHADKCVDLHLSYFPFVDGARERLAGIGATVVIQELN